MFTSLTQACEYGSKITNDGNLLGLITYNSNGDVTTNAGVDNGCTMANVDVQAVSLAVGQRVYSGVTTDCLLLSDGIYFVPSSQGNHLAVQVINGFITQILQCPVATPTPTTTPTATPRR